MTGVPIRAFLVSFLVAAAFIAAGFWFLNGRHLSGIEVIHPARGPAVHAVYATGTVEATVMLPIAARAPARLIELNADEGSDVTKGQALARLEDRDLQKALESLRAKADYAQKDYDRKSAIAAKGYETKANIDSARAALDAARAAVGEAEAQAGYMTLTAPADGHIIRRDGEIGEMIAANQPVFWLSCCAPLRVSAEVDEEDIPAVKTGQEVLIRADAFPGKVFHGAVQSITPKGDPVARSFRVRISLDGETPLQIGMTAETNIIAEKRDNALLLPSGAIVDGAYVWVVKDGKLERRNVKTGAAGEAKTEIREGLSESDAVILSPNSRMKDGQRIKTTPAQAPPA